MLCLQVPWLVQMAKQALAEGKCVVIGLQSTGEARTADVVSERGEELDDFVSGPRVSSSPHICDAGMLGFICEPCSMHEEPELCLMSIVCHAGFQLVWMMNVLHHSKACVRAGCLLARLLAQGLGLPPCSLAVCQLLA